VKYSPLSAHINVATGIIGVNMWVSFLN